VGRNRLRQRISIRAPGLQSSFGHALKEVIMNFKYVVAIVRPELATALEEKLSAVGVGGITLSKVKGFGEYKNLFSRDWLREFTKVEIFTEESKVDALLDVLQESAEADVPGIGVVAVMAVDRFLHLHKRRQDRSRLAVAVA
jgi:nitrogen regulatory protein P-II 1